MSEFWQALAQGVLIGSTYGLLALGMGLVYGVSGIVNFAHGDFISLAMFMSLALFSAFAMDPYVSAIITIPVMAAIGALVYRFLLRPMAGHQFLMIVQLTLGLSLLLQNGILMVFGGQPARVPSVVESKLIILGDVVLRMPKAYPIYDSAYAGHLDVIRGHIDAIPNLHTVGRNGMHKYNNQDHAMMTGLLTAENIIAGEIVHDVWEVNEDAEYGEAGVSGAREALRGERLVPAKVAA